uniref:hypothetical protein n=1 Tax=Dorea longicatena TaxID=88431 RepID=UPI0022E646B6
MLDGNQKSSGIAPEKKNKITVDNIMIFLISCRLRQTKVWRKDSGRTAEKLVEKRLKKFLTNVNEYDNLNKL